MLVEAKEAGASYVKIQSIFANEITLRNEFENKKARTPYIYRPYKKEYERLSKLELSMDDHKFFIQEACNLGLTPLTTAFTKATAHEIIKLDWPKSIVKVASYDGTCYPLIKILASKFKHLIISTGASYDSEIEETNRLLKDEFPETNITYLHCVTKYPQLVTDGRLLRISWLKQFSHSIGLSDHSGRENPLALSKIGIYLGIDYLERHFTSKEYSETKDGPVSINKDECQELVEFSKLDKETQLNNLISTYGRKLINLTLTYNSSMSTIDEVKTRSYYRGRFASKDSKGEYDYNWL